MYRAVRAARLNSYLLGGAELQIESLFKGLSCGALGGSSSKFSDRLIPAAWFENLTSTITFSSLLGGF
uniref:Uncharacterized protein n=1 Tax=Ascaris lumbricoides TaxID=6252 RepID=A0A0M3HPH7_ASCLU